MHAHFEIDVDPGRDLVRTKLSGFFTLETVADYVAARKAAFAELRCPVTEHLALTDLRELKIQSQDVVAAFASLLADRSNQARRLAFIVASTLSRTQVQRAIGDRDARWFTDASEAKTWLLAELKRSEPAKTTDKPLCWADRVTKARTESIKDRLAKVGRSQA